MPYLSLAPYKHSRITTNFTISVRKTAIVWRLSNELLEQLSWTSNTLVDVKIGLESDIGKARLLRAEKGWALNYNFNNTQAVVLRIARNCLAARKIPQLPEMFPAKEIPYQFLANSSGLEFRLPWIVDFAQHEVKLARRAS